jgi:hypothetical protein
LALRACLGRCGRYIASGSYCSACKPRNGSTRQWRRTREAVFAIHGRRCFYCGRPAEHVDHVVPVRDGGVSEALNLRPACADCNLRKGRRVAACVRLGAADSFEGFVLALVALHAHDPAVAQRP